MRVPFALLSVAALLAGCSGGSTDEGDGTPDPTPTPWTPLPAPEGVTGLEHVAQLQRNGSAYPMGSGNFVLDGIVYGSSLSEGFFIADVRDPANPVLLFEAGEDSPTPYARKAEVVSHLDGRRTLALATGSGIGLWDVTDPAHPVYGSTIEKATHYVAQVPGTDMVLSNPSNGEGGTNTFYDVSDPFNPAEVGTFGQYGCHGTTFLNAFGHEKFRGYCAGVDATEIWDMTGFDPDADGLGIRVLSTVGRQQNPLIGAGGLHHLATANTDGTVLLIGDEYSGGGQPGACYSPPAGPASTPLGALWFYDVADEANPVLKGWVSPPAMTPVNPPLPLPPNPVTGTPGAGCTAHFGQVIPGQEKVVIAWYNAGVLLIDFEDPAAPVILDQQRLPGTDTWSARVEGGYVFTGDIRRGMDVFRLV